MAGYLPFKKEAPKRLVLGNNNITVAITVFVKDVVDEETEDSADILASTTAPTEIVDDTSEELEDVEDDISAKPSIFRRKKKE